MTTHELRELDADISRLAFDNAVCRCDPNRMGPRFDAFDGRCLTCGNEAQRRYSTDPAASDALLDKMGELGYVWSVQSPMMGGGFVVQFVKGNDTYRPTYRMLAGVPLPDPVETVHNRRYFCGRKEADTKHLATALAAKAALESAQSSAP